MTGRTSAVVEVGAGAVLGTDAGGPEVPGLAPGTIDCGEQAAATMAARVRVMAAR